MASKLMNWLVTGKGQMFATIVAGTASVGVFGLYLLPHTYYLKKCQGVVQMYKMGQPVPLDENVLKEAKETLRKTDLYDRERNLVDFFTVFGFDTYHAGSTTLRTGALIGLPINFSYSALSDIDRSQLSINGNKEFSFLSPTGERLLKSLIISPAAKRYAIAREIYYANTHYVYVNAFCSGYMLYISYLVGRLINTKQNLYARPRSHRVILYSIIGCLGFIMYILTSDLIGTYYEGYADEKAAGMGKEYVLGGLEYYGKMLERNKALRAAMGKAGESLYTAGGNVSEMIRVTTVPIDARIDYLKSKLKEFEKVAPVSHGEKIVA